MEEEWKDIERFKGYLQISSMGNIRSIPHYTIDSIGRRQFHRGTVLKQRTDRDGYKVITIKDSTYRIHRLVAEAFIPNPQNYPIINHKDENPANNFVSNLEWCSIKYNNTYGTATERRKQNTDWKKRSKTIMKPIVQCSISGEEIMYWFSIKDAAECLGIDKGSIVHHLKGDRYRKSVGGYKWKYSDKNWKI